MKTSLKRYAYVLTCAANQLALETDKELEPQEVFEAVWPRLQAAESLALVYSVYGGDLDDIYYCKTETALRALGVWKDI